MWGSPCFHRGCIRVLSHKTEQVEAQQIVSEKLLMKDNRVNQEALEEIFHMLMVINPSIEIYLLDPTGRILTRQSSPLLPNLAVLSFITLWAAWIQRESLLSSSMGPKLPMRHWP